MRRLYRSRKNRVIAGVCGGIAEYFNIDPVVVRVLAVLLFFAGGSALLAYIVGLIIIPAAPWEEQIKTAANAPAVAPAAAASAQPAVETSPAGANVGALIIGVVMVVFGAIFMMRQIPFFNHYYWWFWDHAWHFFWPSLIIVIGLLLILKGWKKE